MSLVVLGPLDFPISMLRALRVVRLFGRLKSSKKILAALWVSIVPMCNAFFIMLIVAMMCEFHLNLKLWFFSFKRSFMCIPVQTRFS